MNSSSSIPSRTATDAWDVSGRPDSDALEPLFAWIPVESLIYARQSDYYAAIRESSAKGESTPFIIFMLEAILETVRHSPHDRPRKRPCNRPSGAAARRTAGWPEERCESHGRARPVAPAHVSQQLHSSGTRCRTGRNDPPGVTDGEKPAVSAHGERTGGDAMMRLMELQPDYGRSSGRDYRIPGARASLPTWSATGLRPSAGWKPRSQETSDLGRSWGGLG